jgi:hypothetical protein
MAYAVHPHYWTFTRYGPQLAIPTKLSTAQKLCGLRILLGDAFVRDQQAIADSQLAGCRVEPSCIVFLAEYEH